MQSDNPYDKEIKLLHQMRTSLPHYKDMIDFFEPILHQRGRYMQRLAAGLDIHLAEDHLYEMKIREGFPLLTKNDIACDSPIVNDHFLNLVNMMKGQAADRIEIFESIIGQNTKFRLVDLIDDDFSIKDVTPDSVIIEFLISETLGPLLKLYTDKLENRVKLTDWARGYCPVCGKNPAFASLKADDGKRTLACSMCGFHWEFKRIQCPFCGNEDQKLLSYLAVENDDMYRIETCDACRCYLKTIVLKNAAHEIFYDVESIITLHLDIIARDNGYSDACSAKG